MKTYKIQSVYPRELADYLNAEFKNISQWNPKTITRKDRGGSVEYECNYWLVRIMWGNPCFHLEIKEPAKTRKFIHFRKGLSFWTKTGKFVIS